MNTRAGLPKSCSPSSGRAALGIVVLLWAVSALYGQSSPVAGSRAGLRLAHAASTTNRVQFFMNGRNLGSSGLVPGYAGGVAGFPAGKSMFSAKSGEESSQPLSVELMPGRNVTVVAFHQPVPEKDKKPGKPDKALTLFSVPQEPIGEGKRRYRLLLLGEPSCEILCNDQKINLEGGKIQTMPGDPQSLVIRQGEKVLVERTPATPGDFVVLLYRDAAGAWASSFYEDRIETFSGG